MYMYMYPCPPPPADLPYPPSESVPKGESVLFLRVFAFLRSPGRGGLFRMSSYEIWVLGGYPCTGHTVDYEPFVQRKFTSFNVLLY